MDAIATKTTHRLHPLMAAAAVAVIAFSGVGIAAVTGVLPSSKANTADVQPAGATLPAPSAAYAAQDGMPTSAAAVAQAEPAAEPAPAPKPAPRTHHVVHHTSAPAAQPTYAAQPQPVQQTQQVQQQRQPNYLAIGTGAVIGGVLGNQVGSGRGRTLATVAGAIGGGMIANNMANKQQ
ncbi:MAG: glycine zipper 2TM domain-containing protein [Telluria sp.]